MLGDFLNSIKEQILMLGSQEEQSLPASGKAPNLHHEGIHFPAPP